MEAQYSDEALDKIFEEQYGEAVDVLMSSKKGKNISSEKLSLAYEKVKPLIRLSSKESSLLIALGINK